MLPGRFKIAVTGSAYSSVAQHSDAGVGALAVEASLKAIDDAGLRVQEIDAVVSCHRPQESMPGQVEGVDYAGSQLVIRALKLRDLKWFTSLDRAQMGGALVEAIQAVYARSCECVLVIRALRNRRNRPELRFHDELAPTGRAFTDPYGLPAMGQALPYSEYLARYGATREHMGAYMVGTRKHAAANPDALFHDRPITTADYANSPMISEPLSLMDFDVPVDGASALVVTSAERARSLKQPPAYIAGYAALGFDYYGRGVPTWDANFEAARVLGDALWRNAGVTAADIDTVQVYEPVSPLVYLWLEALGFCKPGEAFQFVQDGRTEVGGALPVNTSGGSLGMGRLHGGAQLIEAARQVQGRCGARQVAGAGFAVAAVGLPTAGAGAVVFSSDPAGWP